MTDFLFGLGIGLVIAGWMFNGWMTERAIALRWKKSYYKAMDSWMDCNAEWLRVSLARLSGQPVELFTEAREETKH